MAQGKKSISREELRELYAALADAIALANMTEPVRELPPGALAALATRIERDVPHGQALAEFLRRASRHVENHQQRALERKVPGTAASEVEAD
jgi:acetyl esterase/lipase